MVESVPRIQVTGTYTSSSTTPWLGILGTYLDPLFSGSLSADGRHFTRLLEAPGVLMCRKGLGLCLGACQCWRVLGEAIITTVTVVILITTTPPLP